MNAFRFGSRSVLVVLLVAGLSVGFPNGAPIGSTGAPGEFDCTVCHNSFPLNSGSDIFELGLPPALMGTGPLTVPISFPLTFTPFHGFEVTSRNNLDLPVGTWTITQPQSTQLLPSGKHVTHTLLGSFETNWSVDWTPPTPLVAGPVTFYAAGNAANGDGAPTGDEIYTVAVKVYQASLTSPEGPSWTTGLLHTLNLSAPTRPFDLYLLLVSEVIGPPTSVGGGLDLPLSIGTLTPLAFNLPSIFQNFVNLLDASGQAQAQVLVPAAPALAGLQLHFAFVTLDTLLGIPGEVSSPLTITFQ